MVLIGYGIHHGSHRVWNTGKSWFSWGMEYREIMVLMGYGIQGNQG